jgi:hypothetical protein
MAHKILDALDDIKLKLTDEEYKRIAELCKEVHDAEQDVVDNTYWVHAYFKVPRPYVDEDGCIIYDIQEYVYPVKEFVGIPWTQTCITDAFTVSDVECVLTSTTQKWIRLYKEREVVIEIGCHCDEIRVPSMFVAVRLTPCPHTTYMSLLT